MTTLIDNEAKNAYVLKMNTQLEEWSARISLIKSKVDNRSLQVRNDYHENMSEWKSKKENFKNKLDEILKHTGTNFESLRFGAQIARNDVFTVFKRFSELN